MLTTPPDSEHGEESVPAAQIRVLWAAEMAPNLNALSAVHVGLNCLHIGKKSASAANATEPLTTDVLTAIADAHMLFVVSDVESEAWAQQIDAACKQANKNAPFRIRMLDHPEATCVAIRSMTEMLNVYSFIGIDIEDVRFALDGQGFITIGTGVATGQDRAHIAAMQALANANLIACDAACDAPTVQGALLIISAAPSKLPLSECSSIRTRFVDRLSDDTKWVYGMNHDASLGEAIRVAIFVNRTSA